jgi:SAM-dependent methyltransferase
MDGPIKEKLMESYDNNSGLRDRMNMDPWKVNEMNLFLKAVKELKGLQVLDLGSGPGKHGLYFKDNGLDVTCIDLSPNMIEACQAKGLDARVMDLYNLDFEEGTFDAVWSMNCLLHVPKNTLEAVLHDIKRVMKPGGYFYMGVYGGYQHEGVWEEDPYTPHRFFSFYEDEAIKKVVSRVFEIVRFEHIPMEGMNTDYQSMILKKQ